MTTRKRFWTGLALLVLLLPGFFIAGCARKDALKDETVLRREEIPAVTVPEKPLPDEKEIAARTLREQMLREREKREDTLQERAAEAVEKAPASAEKEAVEREAAVLRELRIPDIHFDFNEYRLKPESREILQAAAPAYLKYPTATLVIEGHTDERGTAEYNLALGQRRADEAAQFLIHLGIVKERIRTVTYGKERPLDPGQDEAAWARNRRVRFVVSKPVR
jgi:peptidoglycan-associated lipoprotein